MANKGGPDVAEPYATVIIPTLDRAATLPESLASAQAQTVANIEILVVLDGATPDCREIAFSAAGQDARIRVLDLPKAPGNGERNVHHAISGARSDRIFYNDDDDVLLPCHVGTLGPLLDRADIAESRVASADRQNELHLAPCPTSGEHLRNLLATYRHKTIFDTHIAHTRSGYQKFTAWVPDNGETTRPVWDFIAGFAKNPNCVWASCSKVTAVSLHGANRRDMDAARRRTEIEWWGQICRREAAISELLDRSNSVVHLARLLNQDPAKCSDFDQYLELTDAYDDVAADPLARALFSLTRGKTCDPGLARQLADLLSRPAFVGYMINPLANALQRSFGLQASIDLVSDPVGQSEPRPTGALALLAMLQFRNNDFAGAGNSAALALKQGPDILGQLSALHEKVSR